MPVSSKNKKPPFTNRHQGRELALQLLYAFEMISGKGPGSISTLKTVIANYKIVEREHEIPLNDFTIDLLQTVINNLGQVDQHLKDVITNWKLDRLSHIDRNLLRLAVAEIYFFGDIPPKVTINEYIDIAKEYSTPQSGQFVNGILDNIHKDLVRDGNMQKTEYKKH